MRPSFFQALTLNGNKINKYTELEQKNEICMTNYPYYTQPSLPSVIISHNNIQHN